MVLLLWVCVPITLADTATGPKKRSWVQVDTYDFDFGVFGGGPPAISSFACAAAGGMVFMFGGHDLTEGEGSRA
jgi:hypothetical protein